MYDEGRLSGLETDTLINAARTNTVEMKDFIFMFGGEYVIFLKQCWYTEMSIETDVLSYAHVALYSNISNIIAFQLSKNDLTYPKLRR